MIASLLVIGSSGCSPGRIGGDGGSEAGDESESSVGSTEFGSDLEGSATSSSDGDGDEQGDGDGEDDTCGDPNSLDFCDPPDPCLALDCDACIAGFCVEPTPAEPCAELLLTEMDGVALVGGQPLLANFDGIAGDELVTARDGRIWAQIADQVVESYFPTDPVKRLHALRIDGDAHTDLLIVGQDQLAFLLGDGAGEFTLAPDVIPLQPDWPEAFPIDFDNDGAHELVVWGLLAGMPELYTNQNGEFVLDGPLAVDARLGRAIDLDQDGFVNDALLADYPTVAALIGGSGSLLVSAPLPEGPSTRSPVEYGTPVVADLDGDGFVEVLSPIEATYDRFGIRVWWGSANGFADPRDQQLPEGPFYGLAQLEVVELDGVTPPELLLRTDGVELVYARPDLDNRLPVGCFSPLFDIGSDVVIGDLEADGQPEFAVESLGAGVKVFGGSSP